MPTLSLKANHKPIREYYKQLKEYAKLGHSHEGAVKDAFTDVLKVCGQQFNWTLVGEYSIKKGKGKLIWVDGILQDEFGWIHGYWEAKDLGDNLPKWVKQKFQIQRFPHPDRHSPRNLPLSSRQSLCPRLDYRPIPDQNRQT